jgi:hypothetical protein
VRKSISRSTEKALAAVDGDHRADPDRTHRLRDAERMGGYWTQQWTELAVAGGREEPRTYRTGPRYRCGSRD